MKVKTHVGEAKKKEKPEVQFRMLNISDGETTLK